MPGSVAKRGAVPHRQRLERSFGESLADVSVRVAPAELAPFGAEAATRGDSIVLADPSAPIDVLAHEIAHVVQNRHASAPPPAAVGPEGGPAEVEAQAAARAVRAGEPASVSAAPGGEVQFFLGLGKKKGKKRPARPTQALPQPTAGPTGAPFDPARIHGQVPKPAAAAPAPVAVAAIPPAPDPDPFVEREFNLAQDPDPDPVPLTPAADSAGGPDWRPDAQGKIKVRGNPYLEALVARYHSSRGLAEYGGHDPRSPGEIRNLEIIAGIPPDDRVDLGYMSDWGPDWQPIRRGWSPY